MNTGMSGLCIFPSTSIHFSIIQNTSVYFYMMEQNDIVLMYTNIHINTYLGKILVTHSNKKETFGNRANVLKPSGNRADCWKQSRNETDFLKPFVDEAAFWGFLTPQLVFRSRCFHLLLPFTASKCNVSIYEMGYRDPFGVQHEYGLECFLTSLSCYNQLTCPT